jgi:hypothetical protein
MKALLSVPVLPEPARATSGIQIARRALKQLLLHVDSGRLKWDTRISLSIEHCQGCECATLFCFPPLPRRLSLCNAVRLLFFNAVRMYHRHVCWHSADVYADCAALLRKSVALVLHGFDVHVVVSRRSRAPALEKCDTLCRLTTASACRTHTRGSAPSRSRRFGTARGRYRTEKM